MSTPRVVDAFIIEELAKRERRKNEIVRPEVLLPLEGVDQTPAEPAPSAAPVVQFTL